MSFVDFNLIRFLIGGFLLWVGVYSVSNNIRSKLSWLMFLFLTSLSWYIIMVDAVTVPFGKDIKFIPIFNEITTWSYLLPIPILLHFSTVLTNQSDLLRNKISLYAGYIITIILIILSFNTDLVVKNHTTVYFSQVWGYYNARGVLFPIIAPLSAWMAGFAAWNYFSAYHMEKEVNKRIKFLLPAIANVLYFFIGPFLVYLYFSTYYNFTVYVTSPLLIGPTIFILISMLFYRLISDIDAIFNLKEFTFLTAANAVLIFIYILVFNKFIFSFGIYSLLVLAGFIYLVIITHGFYNWLTTFLRDLLYNINSGFSLITDSDVNDLIKNFHNPEKLETNSIIRFNYVKKKAEGGKLIDASQELIEDAIEYFKQKDYPRRTKANLKHQILKMTTLDDSEEGQILWELGFEGYPIKIMTGEDSTRKPLFKIESMSDYTAVSRNAFIALKKEAIHDLAWRLSYLEKTANKR